MHRKRNRMRGMKQFFLMALLALLALLAGCVSGCASLPKVVRELKDDPAVVKLDIITMSGSGRLIRIGEMTNTVEVTPEGKVTINPRKP